MTSRIKTVDPDEAKGLRRLMMKMTKRQMGGMVPGIQRIVMTDFQIGTPTYWLYGRLNLRKGSPLSQLSEPLYGLVTPPRNPHNDSSARYLCAQPPRT